MIEGVKFSVVIPLYNKEAFIRRCVDSVLLQTFTEFELIIVDDGSTDKSLSVIKSISDKRIRIVSQSNQGVGLARNRGVVESKAEWVAFLDADDLWARDHLRELCKVIQKYEDVGIASTRSVEVGAGKNPDLSASNRNWKIKKVDYLKEVGSTKGLLNSSSVIVRRTVFDRVGYFKDFQQGEDTEFWSRVCLVYPCAVSEKPTSFYCRGTGGRMETSFKESSSQKPSITSVKDIGPAVSYLATELESGNVREELIASVAIFINSRITTELRGALYSGRVEGMREISDLYIQPISLKNQAWKTLSRQRYGFLMTVFGLRSFVRAIYRYVMNKIN